MRVVLGRRLASAEADGDWPLSPSLRLRVWLARVTSGEPAPLEDHDALRVLPAEGWRQVAWLPGDVAPLEALARGAGWSPGP